MQANEIDPATLARLKAAVGGAPGEREVVIAQLQRMDIAAAEQGLCGRLRRAVAKSATPISTLADAVGVRSALLQDFLEGLKDLDSAAMERLADHLGLTLVYALDPLAVERVAQ
jgi:hypothetical protein